MLNPLSHTGRASYQIFISAFCVWENGKQEEQKFLPSGSSV